MTKPQPIPELPEDFRIFTVGRYTATLDEERSKVTPHNWEGTRHWRITDEEGREVGTLWEGPGYGWGRVSASMSKLVWSGHLPVGHMSTKSEHYGIHFDTVAQDGHVAALTQFGKQADRLRAWREANPKEPQ